MSPVFIFGFFQVDINSYTLFNIFYGLFNAVPMVTISYMVFKRDSSSIINRLFSLGSLSFAIAFMLFPIGGLFYYMTIFDIPILQVSTRLFFFFMQSSLLLVCWCSIVLLKGDIFWDQKHNLVFISVLFFLNVFGLLTPDAVILISGPPEIDTGKGFLYSLIFYPSIVLLLVVMFNNFIRAYIKFNQEEMIIKHQALAFSIGSSLFLLCMPLDIIALILRVHNINYIEFVLSTIGTACMSAGFTRESSFLRFKAITVLYRTKACLERREIKKARSHLHYLNLLNNDQSIPLLEIKILVLEGLIEAFQANLKASRTIFAVAEKLACEHSSRELFAEIQKQKKYLDMLETTNEIRNELEEKTKSYPKYKSLDYITKHIDTYLDELKNSF